MHNYSADIDDSNAITIAGKVGRDAGKAFRVNEVPVRLMAGFVLRLLAALRLGQQDDLLSLVGGEDTADAGGILRVLTGCDPEAVSALLYNALEYVEVAPDPQHPGAFRRLNDNDIREMSTLGDVLGAFIRVNLTPG